MIKKLIYPFQKFVKVESLSGVLLFGATIIALLWANSPWSDSYNSLLGFKMGIDTSGFDLVKPITLWVNDGLMAIFFFLIGLEIKRELSIGELNTPKKAMLPIFAAIGGMIFPAVVYLLMNKDLETANGWAMVMATDIAFSLAIIKLLGDRVPMSLKVFLTAFAIVDDLGAVLIIALFYSGGIQWMLMLAALGLVAFLFILSWRNMYSKYIMVLVAIAVWYLFLKAGIHPTIAGVLVALTVPIGREMQLSEYTDELDEITTNLKNATDPHSKILSNEQIHEIDNLESWSQKVQSPLQHLEHKLHNWVAYLIMPIFALFNAGVSIKSDTELNMYLIFMIITALVVGKAIGITSLSFTAVKAGISKLPDGLNMKQILGTGFLAGVGFTMSIFIANLAFSDNSVLLDSAKIGIISGSLIAGAIGCLMLRISSRKS